MEKKKTKSQKVFFEKKELLFLKANKNKNIF